MTQPKKRKAKPCPECGQAVGHYDDCPAGLGVIRLPVIEHLSRAQAYALRVWHGQSPDAHDRAWRVQRVMLALEKQGLSFEGVVLP